MGWQDGLEGKGALYPEGLSLIPGNHKVEGGNQLLKIVFWLPPCTVVQTPTPFFPKKGHTNEKQNQNFSLETEKLLRPFIYLCGS